MEIITVTLPVAASAAGTFYVAPPKRCVVLGCSASVSADVGDDVDVSILKGSDEVCNADFGSNIAPGAVATGITDAAHGQDIFEKTDSIKIVVGSGGTAGTLVLNLHVDYTLSGVAGA